MTFCFILAEKSKKRTRETIKRNGCSVLFNVTDNFNTARVRIFGKIKKIPNISHQPANKVLNSNDTKLKETTPKQHVLIEKSPKLPAPTKL